MDTGLLVWALKKTITPAVFGHSRGRLRSDGARAGNDEALGVIKTSVVSASGKRLAVVVSVPS